MSDAVGVVLVGAGGFAQEVYSYLKGDIATGRLCGFFMKGVLDDLPDTYYHHSGIDLPYLGRLSEYEFEEDDRVLIAIGSAKERARISLDMSARGAKFLTYVHSSCHVADSAVIGAGSIVCPNSIVNSRAVIDEQVVVNVFCSVGHGARVGKFSVMSPYSALNGDSQVGDLCFLGTRATVFPRVSIGNKCMVDSHSFVKSSVPDGHIVSCRSEYSVIRNRLV